MIIYSVPMALFGLSFQASTSGIGMDVCSRTIVVAVSGLAQAAWRTSLTMLHSGDLGVGHQAPRPCDGKGTCATTDVPLSRSRRKARLKPASNVRQSETLFAPSLQEIALRHNASRSKWVARAARCSASRTSHLPLWYVDGSDLTTGAHVSDIRRVGRPGLTFSPSSS